MAAAGVILAWCVGDQRALSQPEVERAGESQRSDSDPRARARALGEEGLLLFRASEFAEALARFDQAEALVKMPTLSVRSARCLERLGRWVEAAARFRATTLMPIDETLPEDFREAQRKAKEEAEAERRLLLLRIPSITLRLQGLPPDAILVDGIGVPKERWDVPLLLDPGNHTVIVRRGAASESQTVELRATETKEIELRSLPQPAMPRTPQASSDPAELVAPQPRSTPGLVIGGAVLLGTGGLISIVALGAWGVAVDTQTDLERRCSSRVCTPSSLGADGLSTLALHDDAKQVMVASFASASALAAGGLALLIPGITMRSSGEKRDTSLTLALTAGQVVLGGSF